MWAGIGVAVGSAATVITRAVRGNAVADAIREEATRTRKTMECEGEATRKVLGELSVAVAHLQGRVEGMRR